MDSFARTWIRRVLSDGLLLSVVFSTIIVGTALIDPWIMLENYPPAIQELVTPPDDLPVVLPIVIGVGMIVVLVGLMVRSVVALEGERGGHLGFGGAALHAWFLFQFVNGISMSSPEEAAETKPSDNHDTSLGQKVPTA